MPRSNPCLACLLAGNPGKPSRLPDPGDLALIATTLEIKARNDKTGQDEVHRFRGDGPNLYWSTEIRKGKAQGSCLVFPRKHVRWVGHLGPDMQAFKAAGVRKAAELLKGWNDGRSPTDLGNLTVADYRMQPYGKALHIVYRSDKFNEKGVTEDYIHSFEAGVRLAVSPSAGGGLPMAMLIGGGRLKLTPAGLEH